MQKPSGLFSSSSVPNAWILSKVHVVLLLAGMVALWTVLCGVSHRAPDLDGMEELVWASSFEWGYFKHPPLPSWIMYTLSRVFGKPVWLTFFAGQLVSAVALWFIWLLGCEFTTPKKALIAMLMVSVSMYFSLRGTIFNHNTAQLWSIAASIWLFYRALRYKKTSSWVWLGVVSALAVMTKYSAVVQFFAFFVFLLVQGHFKEQVTRRGIVYALIAFMAVLSPHIVWLINDSFASFSYAEHAIAAEADYPRVLRENWAFFYNQVGRLSPMLTVWGCLFYWGRRPRMTAAGLTRQPGSATISVDDRTYAAGLSEWDRAFLLWVGLTPFLATILIFTALKTSLVTSWASTFFVLYGFYAFWWMRGDEQLNLRRTVVLVIAAHVLMAVGYALARGPVAYYLGWNARSTFPGAMISAEMDKAWRSHVPDVPLRLVVSDRWLGGNIAIHIDSRTNVLINGSYSESPWLDPDTALNCGALIAYSPTTHDAPTEELAKLFEHAVWRGVASVPWSTPESTRIIVNWGIIPPGPQCALLERQGGRVGPK